MTQTTEILWTDIFSSNWGGIGTYQNWDTTSNPYEKAKARAEEQRDMLQQAKDLLVAAKAGKAAAYVKLTLGAKAGSIARITDFPEFYSDGQIGDNIKLVDTSYRKNQGWITLENYLRLPYDNHFFAASVNGKQIIEWSDSSSSMKTARPVLLVGYSGPEVLLKGKPQKSKPSIKIKDRYGREVGAGDLAIVGYTRQGTLIVGKIISISDKRTLTIKHIGAEEEMKIPGVLDDQVLLLSDDIKQVLMMEKLKNL